MGVNYLVEHVGRTQRAHVNAYRMVEGLWRRNYSRKTVLRRDDLPPSFGQSIVAFSICSLAMCCRRAVDVHDNFDKSAINIVQ